MEKVLQLSWYIIGNAKECGKYEYTTTDTSVATVLKYLSQILEKKSFAYQDVIADLDFAFRYKIKNYDFLGTDADNDGFLDFLLSIGFLKIDEKDEENLNFYLPCNYSESAYEMDDFITKIYILPKSLTKAIDLLEKNSIPFLLNREMPF